MNSNPNHGNRRKETFMSAITRTTSVAVLVALGLALTAQAAEPAKPAAPVDLDKLVGQPVLDVKGRPVDASFKRQCVQAGEPIDEQTNLVWKRIDLLIEWGFKKGTEALPFDGTIEAIQVGDSPVAMVGKAQPLPGDGATVMTGERAWKSPAAGGARRGIVVPILYTAATRGPGRSVVAVRTTSGSFSFMPADLDGGPILRPEVEKGGRFKAMVKVGDLDGGPILAPEYGFFVAKVASNTTAAAFEKELAAKGLKTIRQRVREMPEQTWEGAMEALYGKREWPAPPQVPYEPKTKIEVPCKYLTGLWRIGAWQIVKNCLRVKRADIKNLKGKMRMGEIQGLCRTAEAGDPEGILMVPDYPYMPLAQETDRILWALDHMGMHDVSRDGLTVWLDHQQPDGALLFGQLDQMHTTGAMVLPYVYAEHYWLTGDKEWLRSQAPQLKAAADYIIKRRRTSMKEQWSAKDLAAVRQGAIPHHGLQPPMSSGGYGGGQNWADFFAYRSVRMLADVLAEADPAMGAELAREADLYRKDLLPVVEEVVALAPVMRTLDGRYHSFHPQRFYDRGPRTQMMPAGWAYGVKAGGGCGDHEADIAVASIAMEVNLPFGLMAVNDPRVEGIFDVLEDVFLRDNPFIRTRKPDYDPNRDWFAFGWGFQAGYERLPECYLMLDDIPNFLRAWLNRMAADLNLRNPRDKKTYWTFDEHTTICPNDKSFENAVFLTCFRKMLAMEIGDVLWLAKATPRAWLEQGKKISIKNAPTHFGTLGYEIVSDVDNGKINATVEMPARKAPKEVVLRFRHPKSAPIKSVTVNGKPWTEFNKDKETITLKGLAGTVAVTAQY